MSQTQIPKEAESQVRKRRVSFSDENHALHLQVFLEWLPTDLHHAPNIDWTHVPGPVMGYLVNTVADNPFAVQMALVAGASSESMDETVLYYHLQTLYRFLRAIQTACGIQSPAELTKERWESVVAKMGITPNLYNGIRRYHSYTENQLAEYIERLTSQQYAKFEYALLPRLPYRFIQQHFSPATMRDEQQQRRKDKSDILAPLHTLLVALVRFRKQAASRLFQAFESAKEHVQNGEASLPLPFSYEEELVTVNREATTVREVRLEKRPVVLSFRLWDFRQWVLDHADDYHPHYVIRARYESEEFALAKREFFVEFLGPEKDLLWFGEVLKYRLLQRNEPSGISPEERQRRMDLLETLGVSKGLSCTRDGLLTPHTGFTQRLSSAMDRTKTLLFDPESLYRGTLYAAALVTLALTNGSRMGELLQVSADRFRMRPYRVRKEGNVLEEERILHLQWLLPKGKRTERQRKLFLISDGAYQLLGEIAQGLRSAHNGRIPIVRIHPGNMKARHLTPERYLFQWAATPDGQGGGLYHNDVENLLRFLLYGLEFRTKQGEPFSVTVHLLRHVTATAARNTHDVSPAAVARALHHEMRPGGAIPESTEYYSQETEERALVDLAAFQTNVEEHAASLLIHWPDEQELQSMDEALRESFERWHTLLETTLGFCGNVDLCPRGYNRTLCIGCPHLVPDPRKLHVALYWRAAYAKLADELEAQGNEVDARQYRLLVRDLDTHINEMTITQASIEDGTRKPVFLQPASAKYDTVVIDAEA
jgi:hypothetical protein